MSSISVFGDIESLPLPVTNSRISTQFANEMPYEPDADKETKKDAKKSKKKKAKSEREDAVEVTGEIDDGIDESDADELLDVAFGGKLDETVERSIDGIGGELDDDELTDKLDINVEGNEFELDLFEPEMLLEMWEDGRQMLHEMNFNRLIPLKKAKSVRTLLIKKKDRDEKENGLLNYLNDYCESVEKQRGFFIGKTKYTDKRRDWALRCIQNYSKKITAGGKVPEWFILALVFVVPEAMAMLKLQSIRTELPDMDIDLASIEAALRARA